MAIVSLVATGFFLSKACAQSVIQDLKAKAENLTAPLTETKDKRLEEVAKFDHQVTGVTVSETGRVFVNFSALAPARRQYDVARRGPLLEASIAVDLHRYA
jgi:hypothetical protein